MAKKKKGSRRGGSDARGYATGSSSAATQPSSVTGTPAASAVKVQVTSKVHDDLVGLLGKRKTTAVTSAQVGDGQQGGRSRGEITTRGVNYTKTSGAAARSDRFVKRLTNVVDRLQQVGFGNMEDLEAVCVALGYNLTLESALDWFCLHYTTEQLPAILTESQVRDGSENKKTRGHRSVDPLTVILASTREVERGQEMRTLLESVNTTMMPQPVGRVSYEQGPRGENTTKSIVGNSEPEGISASEKARLLAQYQYYDDEEEDIQQDDVVAAEATDVLEVTGTDPVPDRESPPVANQNDDDVATDSSVEPHNPHVLQLRAVQKELEETERDVADEASNYMRSKHEIKEMQKRARQLRQQVRGLQRKVDNLRRESAVDEVASTTGDSDQQAGGDGFFDIFSQGDTDPVPEHRIASVQGEGRIEESVPDRVIIPDDAIPKSWTGRTPKVILEEYCRKNKIAKPRYEKLPSNGCRLIIMSSPKRTLETVVPGSKYALLQEYTATIAMYETSPDLPLYRLFPPFFRDLWKCWLEDEQRDKNSVSQAEHHAKQATIDHLLQMIETNVSSTVSTNEIDHEGAREPLVSVDDTPDEWDSNTDDNTIAANKCKPVSSAGERLQAKFQKLQSSPKYRAMLKERCSLPIFGYRDRILQSIQNQSVSIICAETGAGKTTQCPQYILEEALLNGRGDEISILCTQPRRVAATSVAERVCEEMAEAEVGASVGYQIRLEAKRSSRTKLLFCTTGIVLRRLQEDPNLTGVTHIVVDEVHERQYQIDVLLIALRQLVRSSRPDLKIILMSATLDADLFCSFFGGVPLLSVPGRTFPVSSYYLEDLLDATDSMIEEGSPYAVRQYRRAETASLWVTGRGGEKRRQMVSLDSEAEIGDVSDDFEGYKMSTRRSMDRVDEEKINYDLMEDILRLLLVRGEINDVLLAPEGADLSNGSILIFLPGMGEIRTLSERLEGSRDLGNRNKFEVIPLHSSLSPKDQRRAFAKPRPGCRKIIISTNVAETSVTIPDVVCVIDSGRVREVRQNKRTSTSSLVVDWCSRASAKQRAGRAGRVQPGICLKLFSSRTHRVIMKDASEPELRRVPLEEVCLGILAGGLANSCMDFLRQAPQPPTEEAVNSALRVLEEVGAVNLSEKQSRLVESLTPLGHHLSKLPIHVRLGKMLIFSALFRCVQPILTVAAGLSCQSPFASFWGEANEAKAKHKTFADARSDFVTLTNVWDAYSRAASQGPSQARKFVSTNYLSRSALAEIRDMREHFIDLLGGIGFLDRSKLRRNRRWYDPGIGETFDQNSTSFEVVHTVICAGLYPNVAHLVGSPSHGRSLVQNGETLHFHSSSVNSKLASTHGPSAWLTFFEKFETNRTFVSTTSPIHPFAMLIFGGPMVVKHLERKIVMDEWIELGIAAQTGVMFRELRKQVSELLESMIADKHYNKKRGIGSGQGSASDVIDGIIKLLIANSGQEY